MFPQGTIFEHPHRTDKSSSAAIRRSLPSDLHASHLSGMLRGYRRSADASGPPRNHRLHRGLVPARREQQAEAGKIIRCRRKQPVRYRCSVRSETMLHGVARAHMTPDTVLEDLCPGLVFGTVCDLHENPGLRHALPILARPQVSASAGCTSAS